MEGRTERKEMSGEAEGEKVRDGGKIRKGTRERRKRAKKV